MGRNWCVELELAGGAHVIRVFDDYDEAHKCKMNAPDYFYEGVPVEAATLWEM